MSIFVPEALESYLRDNPHPAIAFSGGCDSSYLLYACRELSIDAAPFFVKGAFQTQRELDRASDLAGSLGFELRVIMFDVMSREDIVANPEDRCYLCKKAVFELISEAARKEGRDCIMDGTNASDAFEDRPGMRVLEEMGIRSPLRECQITKEDVRELSREAGLPSWDLPSDSCLATRQPFGMRITEEMLERTESAESEIREMGFTGFRVRTTATGASFEVDPAQQALLDSSRAEVERTLLKYYDSVSFGVRNPQR